jgi:hypothetical protein
MFVICREDGAMVRRPGEASSYTRSLQLARIFRSREQAQAECCGNEHVVAVNL